MSSGGGFRTHQVGVVGEEGKGFRKGVYSTGGDLLVGKTAVGLIWR